MVDDTNPQSLQVHVHDLEHGTSVLACEIDFAPVGITGMNYGDDTLRAEEVVTNPQSGGQAVPAELKDPSDLCDFGGRLTSFGFRP